MIFATRKAIVELCGIQGEYLFHVDHGILLILNNK